jgi:hypothetical protein
MLQSLIDSYFLHQESCKTLPVLEVSWRAAVYSLVLENGESSEHNLNDTKKKILERLF